MNVWIDIPRKGAIRLRMRTGAERFIYKELSFGKSNLLKYWKNV
jgi:hypothetical protein